MDLSKSYEFFKPEMLNGERVHIIGCGAIGSTVAENLVRYGVKDITLWDFDCVEPKNIANQMFRNKDIGKRKTEALADILSDINPDIAECIELENEGWQGEILSGYVFLCPDSIEVRRAIVEKFQNSPYIRGMFDFRMRLTDAQHYAANWEDKKSIENFLATMNFSHEEASEETPRSACNEVLSVNSTIRYIVACGVANFINFVKDGAIRKIILADAFDFAVKAM